MTAPLDRRLFAFREDLADDRLMGKVKAGRFVKGEHAFVTAPVADLRPQPDMEVGIDAQLLHGDRIRVFEQTDDWAWVQNLRDNYVGYLSASDIEMGKPAAATHIVHVPRTFAYASPDMKTPATRALSMGSVLYPSEQETTRGMLYHRTERGDWIIDRHISQNPMVSDSDRPHFTDFVSVAEMLLHTPYLWGGNSAFGLDCSGLIQLSMMMTGRSVQRDSDMQAEGLGEELGFAAMDGGLERGDLVFWKGHVGIMTDTRTLIHANGHTMTVALEKLEDAIERIGYLYGFPTRLRRP